MGILCVSLLCYYVHNLHALVVLSVISLHGIIYCFFLCEVGRDQLHEVKINDYII